MEAIGSFTRVLNVLPREKIEGPPMDFLKANIQGQTKGQKPEGPQAPRVFGLWSGRGCGQGFAFRKFQREYIEYSRDLPRAPFTMIPPRLSHRFSFFLPNALLYYVKCEKNKRTNHFPIEP